MDARLVIAAVCCAGLAAAPPSMARPGSSRPHAAGATLTIARPPAGATLTSAPAGAGTAPATTREAARPAHRAHARVARRHRRKAGGLTARVTAHTAGDPGVTVADFHFSPASTTIHVGDTITWTNNGPSSHTATARRGAFDTGVLKKGQSVSHTFTQAGTFTYFCQIHPFMHGTIVVLAATTSTTPAAATNSTTPAAATTPTATTPAATTPAATTPTATPAATTPAAPAGPTLPNTGFNVGASVFAGLLLLAAGIALRRSRAR